MTTCADSANSFALVHVFGYLIGGLPPPHLSSVNMEVN